MAREILKFSEEGNKNLIPAWKDYMNQYRHVHFGAATTYQNGDLAEKELLLNSALETEIAKLSGGMDITVNPQYITNPTYQWAKFAVVNNLVDMVMPDCIASDFGQFAEVIPVGFGDQAEFDIESSDLFTVTKNGNSRRHVEAQRQFTGHKVLVPTDRTITTEVDMYRVLAGKESLAKYAMKVILSFESELAADIMSTLTESFNILTANFKSASFSENAFVRLAQRVTAANGGSKAVCFGTELGLGTILPDNDYLKMGLGETVVKNGHLPVFKNTQLVPLSQKIQWDSADYDFQIADSDLFFISPAAGKLVKIAIEGGSLAFTDAVDGNANLVQRTSLHKRWAVALISNTKHGMMKVTVA